MFSKLVSDSCLILTPSLPCRDRARNGAAGGGPAREPALQADSDEDSDPVPGNSNAGLRAEAREEELIWPRHFKFRERPRSRPSRHPCDGTVATTHQLGLVVCALTLSILSRGYRLEWDPAAGPPAACVFCKAESTLAEPEFVSTAIAEGARLGASGWYAASLWE